MTEDHIAIFEEHHIRRVYDEKAETWYFSVVDVVRALTDQSDFQTARKYWNKLKSRLKQEGSEVVTNCHRLKMTAEDGKQRLTDVADPETLLRLVQSVPSPKAEPIKMWLAKVGHERLKEMADPEIALNRSRELQIKGLTTQNLRDHMSEAELIFTALAELSTRQIAESIKATGFDENKTAGKMGGGIAKKARRQLEEQTGQKVVNGDAGVKEVKNV